MKTNSCSLCGSLGVTKATCPLNIESTHVKPQKHYLVGNMHGGGIDTSKLVKEEPYLSNIEDLTVHNKNYRKVLYTTPNLQLVLMSLKPNEDIGKEIHRGTTQFFRIEEGTGKAILNGVEHSLKAGDALVVPPGTEHNIINISPKKRLQIYTLYSPPHHPIGTLEKNKPTEIDYISE